MMGQIGQRPQRLFRGVVIEHARQGGVGGTNTFVDAGLEDAVHGVLEQPFVAIALPFQLFQARHQFRVVTLACGMAAEAEQLRQCLMLVIRGLRHRRPRRPAASTSVDW